MAFWGMEGASASDPSTAFECAEDMIARASQKSLGGQAVAIGVGIAKGNIFCGNVGSDRKRQFTVLGPAVNLAARCESYCKELEANIVVPREVFDALTSEQMQKCRINEGYMVRGVGNIDLYSRPLLAFHSS
jgi:adenylate cyclase